MSKPTAKVHDLAADWSVWSHARGFVLQGGRVVWESASYPEGGDMRTVRIQRFVKGCEVRTRYVDPDKAVTLVLADQP